MNDFELEAGPWPLLAALVAASGHVDEARRIVHRMCGDLGLAGLEIISPHTWVTPRCPPPAPSRRHPVPRPS